MFTRMLPPLLAAALLAVPMSPARAAAPAGSAAPGSKDSAARAAEPAAKSAAAAAATAAPSKGKAPASLPGFSLPDLEGKSHASKDWKGQVVLVDFWATWCAGCRETIPALARLQDKYGAQGLKVVGVSLDKGPKAKVGRFAKKLKVNYQVLLDSEDILSKVFGFEGLPSLYLFDRDGGLVKALPGYTALQDKELEGLVAARFK